MNKFKALLDGGMDAVKKASLLSETSKTMQVGITAAVGIIGVSSVVDAGLSASHRRDMLKQKRIQEHQLEKKTNRSNDYRYMGMTAPSSNPGLVQSMFNQRSGHSNTWGGRKY
jgi:hypothetical protein